MTDTDLNQRTKWRLTRSMIIIGLVCWAQHFSVVAQQTPKPLKVFILAGQSNMEGHAKLSSFDHVGMDPETSGMLKMMRGADDSPKQCDRVWISYFTGPNEGGEGFGKLTAGYGARRNPQESNGKIGPEFTFGIYMHKLLDEPILIIKTAWGGKSLHTDFRSPSAGPFQFNEPMLAAIEKRGDDLDEVKAKRAKETGVYYRKMIEHVKHVLNDPGRVCSAYDAESGFELAGFVWFQGWNDMVARDVYPNRDQPDGYELYSQLMGHFIKDVRADLEAPEMPFVIGVLGVGGPVADYDEGKKRYAAVHGNFRKAMAAPASFPEFAGNVTAVLTEECWDAELDVVASKRALVNQRAKELRQANQGYPDEAGTLSPTEQKELVDKFRSETLTAHDEQLLTGITNAEYHYLGSAKIIGQIGKAFAEAVFQLNSQDQD